MPPWPDAGGLRGAPLDGRCAPALHRPLATCSRLADGPLSVGLAALLLSAFHPAPALLLWPFAALAGLARIVLGLHFPSDVFIGALIGLATGSLVFQVA